MIKRIGDKELALLFGFLIFAFVIRIIFIDLRPFHHDEGVNYHFFQQVLRDGYYAYSHQNYHGPLFFYVHSGFMLLFGESELVLRLPTVLAGVALCFMPFLLRHQLPNNAIWFMIALLAGSSSLVFHSRYMIHEIWLALFSLPMGIGTYRFFRQPDRSVALWTAICITLCFTLKETAVLLIGALGLSVLLTFGFRRSWDGIVKLFSFGPELVLVSGLILIFIFSGAFQWMAGVREFFLAFPQWVERGVGDGGHFKPLYYYFLLLLRTDAVLTCGFLGLIPLLARLEHTSEKPLEESVERECLIFFSVWSFILIVGHSAIPYKMPWIHIQWLPPLAVATGLLFYKVMTVSRSFFAVLCCIAVSLHLLLLGIWNFYIPYGPKNPLSYVHTSQGMLTVADRVTELLLSNENEKILVGLESYWPLPYYLREIASQVNYSRAKDLRGAARNFAIILVDKKRRAEVERPPFDNCYSKELYRFADHSEGFLIINRCRLDLPAINATDDVN